MADLSAYRALREPRHEVLRVRGLDMHVTRWGPPPSAVLPVFLLHGWMDAGATFQFMVDALARDRPLIAPDWRGFGGSEWSQQGYWFADYFADLEALLDLLCPGAPVSLVGHSMGGNIASAYAGLRPERVRCVVNLEGVGLARTSPEQAPLRLRKWLEQMKSATPRKDYASFDELAAVIRFRYPRFSAPQAAFVAEAWGRVDANGRVRLAGDPRHHWVNPVLYKREDTEACWRAVQSPMLLVLGELSDHLAKLGEDGDIERLRALVPYIEIAHIAAAGHMLHIEKPDLVATLVGNFLNRHQP